MLQSINGTNLFQYGVFSPSYVSNYGKFANLKGSTNNNNALITSKNI